MRVESRKPVGRVVEDDIEADHLGAVLGQSIDQLGPDRPKEDARRRRELLGVEAAAIERDDGKRIARLKQDDWQIAFNYPTAEATRPSRLDIAGNDAQIRLAIDNLSRDAP